MVEAAPVAAFVVREAELGFELLVIAFDHPAPHGIEDELPERGLFAQRRQPVVAWLGLTVRPFDEKPFLLARQIVVCRAHPHPCEARRQPAFRAVAPAHRAPALRRQGTGKVEHRQRLVAGVAFDMLARPLTAGALPLEPLVAMLTLRMRA